MVLGGNTAKCVWGGRSLAHVVWIGGGASYAAGRSVRVVVLCKIITSLGANVKNIYFILVVGVQNWVVVLENNIEFLRFGKIFDFDAPCSSAFERYYLWISIQLRKLIGRIFVIFQAISRKITHFALFSVEMARCENEENHMKLFTMLEIFELWITQVIGSCKRKFDMKSP